MSRITEVSVGSMNHAVLFWVIKNLNTNKYFSDDSKWVDDFFDAEVLEEDTLDQRLEDAIDSYDFNDLGPEVLDKHIADEKRIWAEDYDNQPKNKYNVIDDWNLKDQVKQIIKPIPIYAEHFHEFRSEFQKQIDLTVLDLINAEGEKLAHSIRQMAKKFKPEDGPIRYIAGRKVFKSAEEAARYQQELFRSKQI